MNRKILFDAVRRLLGRRFAQSEVDALDDAMDAALGIDPRGSALRVPSSEVSEAGIRLIKNFEGCARRLSDGRYQAYPDPGSGGAPWTIGWGATGRGIGPDTIWTQAQCDERLQTDVARHAREVAQAIGDTPTSQNQFDALVSFHYNTGAIARATLTRLHRAGHFHEAAAEFHRWKYASGKVLKGLENRRSAEAALYRLRQ